MSPSIALGIGLGMGGAVKPWSPSDMLPRWWLKADPADITLTGADVSAWADRSGYGHHASAAAGIPRWVAAHAALNGQPTVEFTSAEDIDDVAGSEAASDWTIFAVVDVPSHAAVACWVVDDAATLQPALRTNSATKHLGYWTATDGWVDIAAPLDGPQWIVWRFEQAANEGRIYRNGSDLGAGTYAATKTPLVGATGGFVMSGHTGYTVNMSELIAIPRACTAAELAAFARYCGKYGL